jgi:hypothetical protein
MAQHFEIQPDYYTASHELDPTRLKIAVQSNKENQEMGQKVVEYLQANGYHRAFLSQQFATQTLLKTKIVAQQGDNYSAAQIRGDLGVGEVIVESTGVLTSDITIQLGQDWIFPEFNHDQDTSFKTI